MQGTYREFTKAFPDIVTADPPAAGPRDGMADKNTALGEYVNRTLSAVQVKPPSTDTSRATGPPTEADAGERQTTEVEDMKIADTLKTCEWIDRRATILIRHHLLCNRPKFAHGPRINKARSCESHRGASIKRAEVREDGHNL